MNIPQVFETQAQACAALGSPFTAAVLRNAADLLPVIGPVGDKILTWPGDASVTADSVPLRLAGGLHALVLTDQDAGLSACYPRQGQPGDPNALPDALRRALIENADHLLTWLDSPPQTNESARSAPLVAAGALLMARYGLPLRLLELGASAGLNLRWHQIALDLSGNRFGPQDAPMILTPEWRGDMPDTHPIQIAGRAGVDLNPLDATRPQDRLRLLSYVWPDQQERLARMRHALDLAQTDPVKITKADAIDWLADQLATPHAGTTTTIFHTVAWQYFPKSVQERGALMIEQAGQTAPADAPLAWLSMENDGSDNIGAALNLRLWPGDRRIDLGRADFHGRWVDWRGDSASLSDEATTSTVRGTRHENP